MGSEMCIRDRTLYGLRGEIKGELLKVEFFKDDKWVPIGEVKYPGTHKKGGIGVGRATAQVAWKYLKVNGPGIPKDEERSKGPNNTASMPSTSKVGSASAYPRS